MWKASGAAIAVRNKVKHKKKLEMGDKTELGRGDKMNVLLK